MTKRFELTMWIKLNIFCCWFVSKVLFKVKETKIANLTLDIFKAKLNEA